MGYKEILETNPVLLVQGTTAFVAVCGALGAKELIASAVNRWWKKADEKDTDHKKIEELSEKVDMIIEKLETIQEHDKQGMRNDLIILETELAQLQNRAIIKGKVSSSCMPRYMRNYDVYIKLAEETEGYEASEEIKLNHQRILLLVKEGKVADSVEEWYK